MQCVSCGAPYWPLTMCPGDQQPCRHQHRVGLCKGKHHRRHNLTSQEGDCNLATFSLSDAGLSSAEILLSFSSKCRANIACYRNVVAKELCQSSGSKPSATSRSRQYHYLKVCSLMAVGNPCMPDQPCQARRLFLACYAISLDQRRDQNPRPHPE